MKQLIVPALDEQHRYFVARILNDTAKIEWATAQELAAKAPGAVFESEDWEILGRIASESEATGIKAEFRDAFLAGESVANPTHRSDIGSSATLSAEQSARLSDAERKRIFEEEALREQARRHIQDEERVRDEARRLSTLTLTPEREAFINRWSWGGAVGEWIYLFSMQAPKQAVIVLLISLIPYLGGLAMFVYVGLKGRSIAWQSRKWKDYEDFVACQRIWDKWGVWIFGVIVVLLVLLALADPS
ncbi:MAG TPA: hypothetical protein VIV15_00215, partial [Anaerolineales bacterium]